MLVLNEHRIALFVLLDRLTRTDVCMFAGANGTSYAHDRVLTTRLSSAFMCSAFRPSAHNVKGASFMVAIPPAPLLDRSDTHWRFA